MGDTVLSKRAAESLSGKLHEFAKGLPQQEQDVLGWILTRAKASDTGELSDSELAAVSGGQSLSSDLASAAGFAPGDEGESKVTVGWTYSF